MSKHEPWCALSGGTANSQACTCRESMQQLRERIAQLQNEAQLLRAADARASMYLSIATDRLDAGAAYEGGHFDCDYEHPIHGRITELCREMARITAENQRLQSELTIHYLSSEVDAEIARLKAALSWSLKNAANLVGAEIITHLRARYLERLNPPPEFAAVIGEVVEQITKGNAND